MCFQQKPILMKTFHEPQFVVLQVYELQTEGNSDKDFC